MAQSEDTQQAHDLLYNTTDYISNPAEEEVYEESLQKQWDREFEQWRQQMRKKKGLTPKQIIADFDRWTVQEREKMWKLQDQIRGVTPRQVKKEQLKWDRIEEQRKKNGGSIKNPWLKFIKSNMKRRHKGEPMSEFLKRLSQMYQ